MIPVFPMMGLPVVPGALVLPWPDWAEPWAPWLVWSVLLSAICVGLANPYKRRFKRKYPDEWASSTLNSKRRILAPVLIFLGAAIGGPTFYAVELVQKLSDEQPKQLILALVLGGGVGAFSPLLYDLGAAVIEQIDRTIKAAGKGARGAVRRQLGDPDDTADESPPIPEGVDEAFEASLEAFEAAGLDFPAPAGGAVLDAAERTPTTANKVVRLPTRPRPVHEEDDDGGSPDDVA